MRGVIPELDSITYIPARDQWCCSNAVKDWVVLHSIEAGEFDWTAENCARYFQNPGDRVASTQWVVDNDSTIRCSGYNMRTAAAVGANERGWHIEQAGFAGQSKRDWTDLYSLAMILGQTAPLVAALCIRDNIPVRFVDAAGLKRGERGITTHHECWKAFGGDVRTDPGAEYPMDTLLWEVEMLIDGTAPQPTTEEEEIMGALESIQTEFVNQDTRQRRYYDQRDYELKLFLLDVRDQLGIFVDERTDQIFDLLVETNAITREHADEVKAKLAPLPNVNIPIPEPPTEGDTPT